jgi:Arc/MetJ family transcription regulator
MKHLVDMDDDLLQEAMERLGTTTIKATVDEALRIATERKKAERQRAWERFARLAQEIPLADRSEAW